MAENPKRGGCGHCPYDENSCYELKRTGGICAYDGVFTEITYEKCKFRKFPTNADRIRSMTDEELAECLGVEIDACTGKPFYECSGNCKECWLEWLRKEVE